MLRTIRYVGNLPFTATEAEVEAIFKGGSGEGESDGGRSVTKVVVERNSKGKSKGFGCVHPLLLLAAAVLFDCVAKRKR